MKQLALVALAVFAVACSSDTPESSPPASSTPAATPPPAASTPPPAAATAAGPRVFFVQPQDGATVKGPLVHVMFGVENFQIAPVPEGTVTTVRPGTGHHHLGVDTDCLPPGTEIIKGTPTWVHFGKGDAMMDMQLTPGKHRLAVQVGDDKHVTLPGLCSAITINVE